MESKEFVRELIDTGHVRITNAPDLIGRRFALTYRSAPSIIGINDRHRSPERVFSGGGGKWGNVTRVDAIDLFEEVSFKDELVFLPVGCRVFKIAQFLYQAIANGNMADRIPELNRPWQLSRNSYFNPFELVDNALTGPGLHVIDRKQFMSRIFDRSSGLPVELKDRALHLFPKDNEPWQGKGLGRLLAALGLEVLKSTEVTEVDYMGSLWWLGEKTLKGLGYKGGKRQEIDDYDWQVIEKAIEPFAANAHK